MEICAKPGMVSDGASGVSNKMKPQAAALGFRVKSGWAAAVLVIGPTHSPKLCDVRRIDLSDPRLPETRQPYHAAMGKLETEMRKINPRLRLVRRIAKQSIVALLALYREKGYRISCAALVAGSKINPGSIANPHIRAHALEGRLFRSALEESLRAQRIHTTVFTERDTYGKAARELDRTDESVRRLIRNFGRDTSAPWRAEQKLAAVAAWLALR